jgi:hypothetical protein
MKILKIIYFSTGFTSILALFISFGIGTYFQIYNIPETDPLINLFKDTAIIGIILGLVWAFFFMMYTILDDFY